jgi:hypothetical protein
LFSKVYAGLGIYSAVVLMERVIVPLPALFLFSKTILTIRKVPVFCRRLTIQKAKPPASTKAFKLLMSTHLANTFIFIILDRHGENPKRDG